MVRSRYRRITSFFARILFGLAFWELILPRLGFKNLAARNRSNRLSRIAIEFRTLAIELGGVMIKVGQFFSARVDVLPGEITTELAGLQDEVPPEKFEDLRQVFEAEFNRSIQNTFMDFEVEPLAAASLGQVHRAKIKVGGDRSSLDESNTSQTLQQVVVKIQRPNIETIISTDLAALRTVVNWLERYRPIRRRVDVHSLLNEFTRILHGEIDYLAEGRHAETFAKNFQGSPEVRVPRVFWDYTTRRVLTLEDVLAIKINDYQAITQAGLDRAEVARRLFNTYLKQIFQDSFFHADPHPGNLFVCPIDPPEEAGLEQPGVRWQLTFVDFGMVGQVPPNMRAGMREMLIAVGTRDAARLVKSYQMMDVLLPEADLSLLERAEAEVFRRFYGKNMTELTQIEMKEVRELATQFRQLMYDLPFQVPEDLILLGRTIGILSGMCTGLDPQFNVWEGIRPFVQKLVAEDVAHRRESWVETAGGLARKLVALPGRTENLLDKVERGQLSVHDPRLAGQMARLEKAVRRATGGVIFAALLLGGIQLFLAGQSPFGEIVLAAAGLILSWVVLSSIRVGK